MRRELPGSRFASLVLAEVAADGRAEVVNAGHCPPLLRRADGEIFALPPNGPILGPLPQSRWSSLTTRLRSDDTLLLVSDGVLEALSPGGDEFGTERLVERARSRWRALAARSWCLACSTRWPVFAGRRRPRTTPRSWPSAPDSASVAGPLTVS